jgi:hypothetical protein
MLARRRLPMHARVGLCRHKRSRVVNPSWVRLCPGERLLGLDRVAHHRTAQQQFPHDARRTVRVLGDRVSPRAGWSGVVAAEEAHKLRDYERAFVSARVTAGRPGA